MATVTVQSSYFDATAVSGIYETDTYEGNVYAGDQTTVSQDYTYAATINHSGIPITVTQVTLHIIVTAADGKTHDYGNYEVAIFDSVAPTIQSIEISPDPATVGASVLIKVRVVD
jgi:hypothetical protein